MEIKFAIILQNNFNFYNFSKTERLIIFLGYAGGTEQ